jgi:hypothetical protein
MRRRLSMPDARAILDQADELRPIKRADPLGKFFGLKYALRKKLKIKTIGAADVPKRARTELRKRNARKREAARRQTAGALPRAQSLSQTRPWEADGVCRRTWERRRRGERDSGVANSCAMTLESIAHESATPARTGEVRTAEEERLACYQHKGERGEPSNEQPEEAAQPR